MAVVALGPYRLQIAESFGPRVIGLTRGDSPDLFARLDESVAIDRPTGAPYVFRGGHRLWASPETPAITYARDDHECISSEGEGSVRVQAPADEAGLVKEMVVSAQSDELSVEHRITSASAPVAAWGITQLRLGGTAILTTPGSDTGSLPDRSIVVWPYTDLADPRLGIANTHITIEASGDTPIKIGFGPVRGRVGYLLDGWLFEKISEQDHGEVPDLGAASQVYVGQGFCELETVGALHPPGEPALLAEWWRLSPCESVPAAIEMLTRGTRP